MIDAFKQFDTYSLQARVFPAILAGLPVLALLFVIVPWDHFGLPHVTAGVMGAILLWAFADVARRTGKHVQARLGTGTTPELWHRDNPDITAGAKDRYRAFVAKQIKLPVPSAEQEEEEPARANDFYDTAGNWLREHTRNRKKFSILFSENVTYGYRRNLLGLKPLALTINAFVLLVCGTVLHFKPPYFAQLPNIDEKLVIVAVAGVLHSAYMFFAVGPAAVREASRTYGRQLILSCEALMKAAPAANRKSPANADR